MLSSALQSTKTVSIYLVQIPFVVTILAHLGPFVHTFVETKAVPVDLIKSVSLTVVVDILPGYPFGSISCAALRPI